MALTQHTDSRTIYLQAKHYCLWREYKTQIAGSEAVEVTNPKTGQVLTKYGHRYDSVSGLVVKLEKYDTDKKYAARYFGFKLHMTDGTDRYVLDMPYQGQMLRRFLRVAHNIDWNKALKITVFKGKKQNTGTDEMGVWFQQSGETVKPYYTKDQPHGMPEAVFDPDLNQWDFKAQHRWLVDRLRNETIPDIEAAASKMAPPIEPALDGQPEDPDIPPSRPLDDSEFISGDDVPF
jgi:hypothetical protein